MTDVPAVLMDVLDTKKHRSLVAAHAAVGSRWIGRSTEERFWSKVSFPAGGHGCWLWHAGKNQDGYGTFNSTGGKIFAHRWSMERSLGRPIRGGMYVLHRCDTPACVNPAHLEEGTQKENVAHCIARQRRAPTPIGYEEAQVIRDACRGGVPQKEMARIYGVSKSLVSTIVKGKRWMLRQA